MKVTYLQICLVSPRLFLSINGNNAGYTTRPVSYCFYRLKKGVISIFCGDALLYFLESTNLLDGFKQPFGSQNCVRIFLNKLGLREIK